MAAKGTSIGRRKTGLVIRPIERIVTSEDIATAQLFAMNNSAKYFSGPSFTRQYFGGASAGTQIGGSLGGGNYSPSSSPGASFTGGEGVSQ